MYRNQYFVKEPNIAKSNLKVHCPLPTVITRCTLPTARCPLLLATAYWPLLTPHCPLPAVFTVHCLLPTIHHPLSLSTNHCLQSTAHCLLPPVNWPLSTAQYYMPTVRCIIWLLSAAQWKCPLCMLYLRCILGSISFWQGDCLSKII
jgi:hypothetical protein